MKKERKRKKEWFNRKCDREKKDMYSMDENEKKTDAENERRIQISKE